MNDSPDPCGDFRPLDPVLAEADLARAVIARLPALLALEARQPGPSFEDVPEGLVEIDAGLLQGHAVVAGYPVIASALFSTASSFFRSCLAESVWPCAR